MVAKGDCADYVDVFTGTAATGHTTPAACRPFGFVQAGPDTGNGDWAYCSGYQFRDAKVLGYSQTHLSGTGCVDMGDAQFVPFTGEMPARPFSRRVDKSRERGEPGYYTTYQTDDALKVEITATKRVAVYRLTAERDGKIRVLFNPAFTHRSVVRRRRPNASARFLTSSISPGRAD